MSDTGRARRTVTRTVSRLLLTLVAALGMTVFGSMAQQAGAAPAANTTIYHECTVVNTLSNGNQANVCNDLISAKVANGTEFWGTGEYYCQGPSQQCKGINANNIMSVNGGPDMPNKAYSCTDGGCPNGARAMVSTAHALLKTGQCTSIITSITPSAAILVNGTSTAFHLRGPFANGVNHICG
jgi:hypothetical protein